MVNKDQIESLLKINGLTLDSSDQHITTALLSARYSRDEANLIIKALRNQQNDTSDENQDGLHKVFRSNDSLRPKEISKLLGIEVDEKQFVPPRERVLNYALLQYVAVWLFSIAIAVGGVFLYMYSVKVGFFYPDQSSNTGAENMQQST